MKNIIANGKQSEKCMGKREFLIESLGQIQARQKKIDDLYKLGIDIFSAGDPLTSYVEKAMAMVVARDEENYGYAHDMVQWWLYDKKPPKIVWEGLDHKIERNLTEVGDFVDWLIQNYG